MEIINIKDIKWDKEIYPRNDYNWVKGYEYAQAIKAGANFPAICVALYRNKFYLIDGKHRIEASKINKFDKIKAEVLTGLTKKQMFVESVKRNVVHGYPLSPQEKRIIALKLKDMKLPEMEISKLINVPVAKMEKFVAQRLAYATTGEEVILKAPMQNLVGTTGDFEEMQRPLASMSQLQILDEIILLVSNEVIDLENPRVKVKMRELKRVITKLKL